MDKLTPYDRNARTHSPDQLDKLAAAITEFGFTSPILVDERGVILAGHGRLMAAKRLSLQCVPVIQITHLTDDQKRAYILADNKIAIEAGWDVQLLDAELQAVLDSGVGLELTGFSEHDMARIADDLAELQFGEIASTKPAPPTKSPPFPDKNLNIPIIMFFRAFLLKKLCY